MTARESLRAEDGAEREKLAWENAQSGEDEDLATLAHEVGAAGLEDALGDPARRETALRALGVAPGFSQVARLAREAEGGSEDHARIALASLAEIGARPRRPVEHEEEAELAAGCETLATLARKADAPRPRRIQAVRAHRLLPCPKAELPADLDTR